MAKVKNPLTPDDRARLQAARRNLADTITLLDAAKSCGVDVAGREQACQEIYDQLEAFNRFFGTGQPQERQT